MKTIGALTTEKINCNWADLDCMDIQQLVDIMLKENMNMVECVSNEKDTISLVISSISNQYLKGGRIIYAGAGTSGRMGVMDAAECPPTFGVTSDSIKGIIAGGYGAMVSAVERIEDIEEQGAADIEELNFNVNDTLVAVSASGRTPYCVGAIKKAKEAGALTVAICNNKDSEMGNVADLAIEIETGPEVIAGSTRLKAASSQKLILNMISSITMIKAGKVYHNLMVDMKATNEKLMDRTERIFEAATGEKDNCRAKEMLEKANGDLKTAIIMHECGVDYCTADKLLNDNGRYVRLAIESYKKNNIC